MSVRKGANLGVASAVESPDVSWYILLAERNCKSQDRIYWKVHFRRVMIKVVSAPMSAQHWGPL
jgi:hypothetical protein